MKTTVDGNDLRREKCFMENYAEGMEMQHDTRKVVRFSSGFLNDVLP